jgi:threonine dehydrogenase-like Zn-dependent dehydrogenase
MAKTTRARSATTTPETMRAVAVIPGKPESLHLRDVPRPPLDEVRGGRGVLVKVIRAGACGTDREIVEAQFGTAPEGQDYLILGHENIGRVVEVGPNVADSIRPGTLVVATVRRPGNSIYDKIGMQDMTTDEPRERGINRLHGFMAEYYVEDAAYLVSLPDSLEPVGVLLEPLSVVEKGIRQAMEVQRRLRVWRPARCAVLGAGTIGLLAALALRLRRLDVAVYSRRRAPYRNSDLVAEIGARYFGSADTSLAQLAEAAGPFDIVLDATGSSALALGAAEIVGANGVLVLASVTGGDATAELATDRINQGFVLNNKVMVGIVNAHRDDFEEGVEDLLRAEASYPGSLAQLITTRISGLEKHEEMLRHLADDEDAIKVVVEVAGS